MNKLRMILLVMLGLSGSWCTAADQNPFLAEAGKFQVVVENLSATFKESGLSESDIQQWAEYSCRKNGLPVNAQAAPWLYVRVSGTRIKTGGRLSGYAYNVHLYFKQIAKTVERDALYTVTSWNSRGTSGVTPPENLGQEIKGAIQDEVEEFANVWMASHEKN